ncbi:MAG TPA: alginate lyase family protein [Vicinamibacterales bacterium]|nr:alginate lyase family protein [Vicinamibacterales bacterium]
MSPAILKRLRTIRSAELRFRAAAALRTGVSRARSTLRSPGWRRESLRLSSETRLDAARAALARRDWRTAHLALARHFAVRPALFPLDPRQLDVLAGRIRARFETAHAVRRADRILQGRHDLLGYRDVELSSPPDWHQDPVNRRTAPLAFWDSVPYLDPACGDHKITWEINRHQHFLALGRAHAVTGDRRYYLEFVRQLADWIRSNPPLLGTNWASMLELGFRCQSWIWALHFFAGAASRDDEAPWTVDLLMALDRQLTHVEQNLSRYFSPNTHLTGEALALYVAGRSVPELAGSDRRSRTGREVLLEEARRQIGADGGHAELSTHYHRYSTDFYLFALNVAHASGDPQQTAFRDAALRQARYLRTIADDRGRIPLIGDDDGGQLFPICGRAAADCADTLATAAVLLDKPALAIGEVPEETYWLCGRRVATEQFEWAPVAAPSTALAASGYYVSRNARGDHLVFDCGPHGYLNGGHAHADALSVVLTVAGRPLLVDPGTATYTMAPERRNRFRSSAMHNTVVLDRRSQSEPAGPFHWRTRTDARCTVWDSTAARDIVHGRHDGYAPLIHAREITAIHGAGWIILDRILGKRPTSAAAMWHFHPDWTLDRIEGHCALLIHADGTRAAFLTSAPLRQVTEKGLDEYAPEYGRLVKTLCLESAIRGVAPLSMLAAIPVDGTRESALELASSVHRS